MIWNQHDERLEDLLTKPKLVGIRDPLVFATKEIKVYKQDGKNLLTDIDLLYKTTRGLWIVEYKATRKHRRKAEHQLSIASDFCRRQFGESPKMLFVTKKYDVEEITYR